MTRRPGGSDGPEDVDAAFAEIVAALEREGVGAAAAEDPEPTTEPGGTPAVKPDPPTSSTPPTEWTGPIEPIVPVEPIEPVTPWRGVRMPWDPDADTADEHFVPPEPPPLPRPRPGTVFGLLLIVVGVFLLAGSSLIGLAPRIATPLSLVSMATGIGWLVLRIRRGGPPSDTDRDDGAQV